MSDVIADTLWEYCNDCYQDEETGEWGDCSCGGQIAKYAFPELTRLRRIEGALVEMVRCFGGLDKSKMYAVALEQARAALANQPTEEKAQDTVEKMPQDVDFVNPRMAPVDKVRPELDQPTDASIGWDHSDGQTA